MWFGLDEPVQTADHFMASGVDVVVGEGAGAGELAHLIAEGRVTCEGGDGGEPVVWGVDEEAGLVVGDDVFVGAGVGGDDG